MNVGKVGRRGNFASVGPLGLLLLLPALCLLVVWRFVVLLARIAWWAICTVVRLVVLGVVWVIRVSRREAEWASSRKDAG